MKKKIIQIKEAVDLINLYKQSIDKKYSEEINNSKFECASEIIASKKINQLEKKLNNMNLSALVNSENGPIVELIEDTPHDVQLHIHTEGDDIPPLQYAVDEAKNRSIFTEQADEIISQKVDPVILPHVHKTMLDLELFVGGMKVVSTNLNDVVFKFNLDNQLLENKDGNLVDVSDINDFSIENEYSINLYDMPDEISNFYPKLKEINKKRKNKLGYKIRKRIYNFKK